ncbi:MAG: hypothetical protein VYB32_06445, partial [Pseudomonadota bacterium]|nr:hypothetical protein [Pseudomonadota bacterium]
MCTAIWGATTTGEIDRVDGSGQAMIARLARQAMIGVTAAAIAGQAAAQVPAPVPTITPPAPTQPGPLAPVARAPVTLPTLSAAQARQLATLIADDEVAQGLRYSRRTDLDRLDGAALVRAALDHARAIRSGRLMPEDFQRDWGIRPPA